MRRVHRPGARRAVGALSARLLLVLAMITGAVALAVAGAPPVEAYTVERFPDEIVFTSQRLHDIQVHATVTLVLRRNGRVTLRANAHNTSRNRKYVDTTAYLESPATGFTEFRVHDDVRVDSGKWRDMEKTYEINYRLIVQYDLIVNDPDLYVNLELNATRIA